MILKDTFTSTGNGQVANLGSHTVSSFAVQVVGTGASATSWTVLLEGSLDGVNFDTIMTHNTATGNGKMLWSGAVLYPSRYIRSNTTAVVLGSATAIVVYVASEDTI